MNYNLAFVSTLTLTESNPYKIQIQTWDVLQYEKGVLVIRLNYLMQVQATALPPLPAQDCVVCSTFVHLMTTGVETSRGPKFLPTFDILAEFLPWFWNFNWPTGSI